MNTCCKYFCLFLLLISCGQKVTSKPAEVSLRVFSSAINPANYPGGIILFGTNGIHSFSTRMPTADSVQTLRLNPPYNWEMFAIGWDGTDPMTISTAIKCGHKQVLLGGVDNNINLNMSAANCLDPSFTESSYIESGNFRTLEIVNCLTFPFNGPVSYSADCGITSAPIAEISSPLSYRIHVLGYDSGKNSQVSPLSSACYSFPTAPGLLTDSFLTTQVRLPFGGPAMRLLNIQITGFSNTNCSGDVEARYNYPKGIPDGANPYPALAVPGTSTLPTRLFIAGNGLGGANTAFKLQRPFLKCKDYLSTNINCTTDTQSGLTPSQVDQMRWPMYNLGGSPTGRDFQGSGGQDRRVVGILGEVWRFLTYTGAALRAKGINDCEAVLTHAGETLRVLDPENGVLHNLKISAGSKTIPESYSGGGTTFDLKLEVWEGTEPVRQIIEINCATEKQKVGWYRTRESRVNNSTTEENYLELFYDFTSQNNPTSLNPVKAEVYSVRKVTGGEKNYQFIRFYQPSVYTYKVLYMRADYKNSSWNNSRVYASADMGSAAAYAGADDNKAWASVASNTNNNTDTTTTIAGPSCLDMTLDKSLEKELHSGCSTIVSTFGELSTLAPLLDSQGVFNIAWLAGSGTGQCTGKSPMECALTPF